MHIYSIIQSKFLSSRKQGTIDKWNKLAKSIIFACEGLFIAFRLLLILLFSLYVTFNESLLSFLFFLFFLDVCMFGTILQCNLPHSNIMPWCVILFGILAILFHSLSWARILCKNRCLFVCMLNRQAIYSWYLYICIYEDIVCEWKVYVYSRKAIQTQIIVSKRRKKSAPQQWNLVEHYNIIEVFLSNIHTHTHKITKTKK